MIRINDELSIPEEELGFTTSRSPGPGGQNVNKVETRVTLRFDIEASVTLNEAQKARLHEQLATRINKVGVLAVHAHKHRTQTANRELVRERFLELVQGALEEAPERRPTRVPRRMKKRRLEKKRQRGQQKRARRSVSPDE